MLGVGKGWTWHEDLVIKASNGQKIYFCHGKYKDVLKVAQQYGMCTVPRTLSHIIQNRLLE